jgi:hypothetical protein
MVLKTIKYLLIFAAVALQSCKGAEERNSDTITSMPELSVALEHLAVLEDSLNQSLAEMNTPFADSVV